MMHICTVATLCFPEKTVPRNYYYCVQDENSLCLCFKNMYRTLFVAIFTSTFIFSMFKSFHTYRNINISNLLKCTYQHLYQQDRRQGFGGRPALLWDLGCPCCGHQDHSCHCRLPGNINSVKLTSRKYPQPPFWKSVFPFSFSLFQQWPSADELPEEIREIAAFNSVRWVHDYQVGNFTW